MRKKANRVLAIIFLIFAIGVLAVGITWSGEVKTSMKDTELRLAEIQQNIDASADNSIISGSVENYNQNVKVYNSYLDMYDMGFKLIMTLSIADLVVVIILIAMDKAGEEETVTPKILPASEKQEKDKDKDNATTGIVSHTDTAVDAGAVSTAGPRANVTSNTSVISSIGADGNGQTGVYTETGANTQQPAATEAKIQKTNLGGQSTIELTKQLRAYKNQLAAGKITEQEFIQRKEELLKSI